MNKVYVVKTEWTNDYDNGETERIYDTKEKALEDFNDIVEGGKENLNLYYDEIDMIDEEDMIEEIDDNYYCIYESNDYLRNHIVARLVEREVL